MAKQLSKAGILEGLLIEAPHVTQSIDAFTGEEAYDITLSGSYTLTGSMYTTDTVYSNNFQASTALTIKGSTSNQLIFLDKDDSNNIRFRNSTGATVRGYVGFSGDNFIINNQQGTGTVSIYNGSEALIVDTSQNISIPSGSLTVEDQTNINDKLIVKNGASSQIELHRDGESLLYWYNTNGSSFRSYIGSGAASDNKFILYNSDDISNVEIYSSGSKAITINKNQSVTLPNGSLIISGSGHGKINLYDQGHNNYINWYYGDGSRRGYLGFTAANTFEISSSGATFKINTNSITSPNADLTLTNGDITLTNGSFNGIGSGSFSGSFVGDGSGLTGTTTEWDGTRDGDASITGSLTLSGSLEFEYDPASPNPHRILLGEDSFPLVFSNNLTGTPSKNIFQFRGGSGRPKLNIYESGKVEIGTSGSNPSGSLEISDSQVPGAVPTLSNDTSQFSVIRANSSGEPVYGLISAPTNFSGSFMLQNQYLGNNTSLGALPLFLNPKGGNVGVGTMNSRLDSKFVVDGDVRADSFGAFNVGTNANSTKIMFPEGGTYTANSGTGRIVVTLPDFSSVSYNMTSQVRGVIKVFSSNPAKTFDVNFSFYLYENGGAREITWESAWITGEPGNYDLNFPITFALNNTTNRATILIGEVSSTWSYPKVIVTDVEISSLQDHSTRGALEIWNKGWNVDINTSSNSYYYNGSASTPIRAVFNPSNSNWYRNGTNLLYNTGNVGIGTSTNPSEKLEIDGTLGFRSSTGTSILCRMFPDSTASSANFIIKNSGTSVASKSIFEFQGSSSKPKLSIYEGGKVEIGVSGSNPSGSLEINDSYAPGVVPALSSDYSNFSIIKTTTSGEPTHGLIAAPINTGEFMLQNQRLGTYSDEALALLLNPKGGNVGINNNSPSESLEVSGRATIAGPNPLHIPSLGASGSQLVISNDLKQYGLQLGVIGSGNSYMQSARIDNTSTSYDLLLQPRGGNVGIGRTTSPTSKLHVEGTNAGGAFKALELHNTSSNTAGTKTLIELPVFNGNTGGVIEEIGNSVDGYRLNIYQAQSSGQMTFGTGTGGAERMRINSTGLVGIGTSSPQSKLHVQGKISGSNLDIAGTTTFGDQLNVTSNNDRPFQIIDSNSSNDATCYISFRDDAATSAERAVIGIDSNDNLRISQVGSSLGAGNFQGLKILREDSNVLIDEGLKTDITSGVRGKIRITSGAGNTNIFADYDYTNPTNPNGDITVEQFFYIRNSNNDESYFIETFPYSQTHTTINKHSLKVQGDILLGTFGSAGSGTIGVDTTGRIQAGSSDKRLKKDITPVTGSLNKLLQLNSYKFKYIEDLKFGDDYHFGHIAQEVQEVFPELVSPRPGDEEHLTLNYMEMIPLLVQSIKEQQDIINGLKDEINDLKNK